MGVMMQELAEDMAAAGHEVTVVTGWPNHPAGVLFPGWEMQFRYMEQVSERMRLVRCTHAICGGRTMYKRLRQYLSFGVSSYLNSLKLGPADVVVSMSTPIFGTWAAYMLARAKNAAFVYEIDDLHPEAARNAGMISEGRVFRLLRRMDTKLCMKSDVVVTLSRHLKESIEARGISAEKTSIVPFWIDTRKIHPRDRMNAWRQSQDIPESAFVALYAGTIGLISGCEVLVHAAEILRDRPEIMILCVGEGVGKEELERQAREKNLLNIRFLPFQPAEVLADVQGTADVGLVTLLPESGKSSIPSKVLGYLAGSRPVIASVPDDSGTADMIREGNCGMVVGCQDSEAIAKAILYAADHRDEVRGMGERGRTFVEGHYSRQACTKKYEELLCRVREEKLGYKLQSFAARDHHVFSIVPIRTVHLEAAVSVHMRAFPGFFLTFLGANFLQEFYRSFTTDPDGVGFVAVDPEGRLLGSVVGPLTPEHYFKRLLKHRWWAFTLASAAAVFRRPWVVPRLVHAIRYRGDSPPGKSRSLLSSISVAPEAQHIGVGQALIDAWVAEAKNRGSSGCFLATDADNNNSTNRFYQRCGWKLEGSYVTTSSRRMNRYVKDFETQPKADAGGRDSQQA